MTDQDEPRTLNPFRVIHRGEDTVDENDNVLFADFSPKVLPADTPEEVDFSVGPKALSVPEPATSSATNEQIVQQSSEELAQELADSESKSETTENPPNPTTPGSDLAGAASS